MELILIIILLILLFGGGFGYYRGGYYSRVVVMASAGYSGLAPNTTRPTMARHTAIRRWFPALASA